MHKLALAEKLFAQLITHTGSTVQLKTRGRFHEFTYQELLGGVGRTVSFFDRELGVMPGPRPACVVCGPAGHQWLLTALACFFRGYRVIALPEKLTAEEVRTSLADLQVDFAVAAPDELKKLDTLDVPLISFDHIPMPDKDRLEAVPHPSSPQIDIVGFTSGTTGGNLLKAFAINADSIEDFGLQFARAYRIVAKDRWLITSPFSHIVHLEYAVTALTIGCNLTIASPMDFIVDPETKAPSILVTVPAVYQAILERMLDTPPPRWNTVCYKLFRRCPSVFYSLGPFRKLVRALQVGMLWRLGGRAKVMIIGAGPSDTEFKKELLAWGLPIYEGYGVSEVGMIACNTPDRYRLGSIGTAFGGISITLSPANEILVGQTRIRSWAYLNGEKQAIVTEGNLVQTGDLATRRRAFLYLEGRAKDLIVLDRGKNITPTKIETAVERYGAVGHCIVHGHGKPYLVALVEPSPSAREEEIKAAIAQANMGLTKHERIRRHYVVPAGTLEARRLITRSLKPRRQKILETYSTQLEALYR